MNVRFKYLYRDAGNFKNWGEIVFSNPNDINCDFIKSTVENMLIEKLYFVANKADVPDLHFEEYKEQFDHNWHEIHNFEPTEEAANDLQGRNIEEFIESLRCSAE